MGLKNRVPPGVSHIKGARAWAESALPVRKIAIIMALSTAVAGAFAFSGDRYAAEGQTSKEQFRVKRHFKVERSANLTPVEALTIYEGVAETMARGYALSQEVAALEFRSWRQYNTTSYRSVTHGSRYVNNYANAKAARYGRLKSGEQMPPGSILVKDSFAVTADGDVYGGPLFIMEKLDEGASPETGGWRYVMIMGDGSYFGDSTNETAERVQFCNGCHQNAAEDQLFFIPTKFRRRFLGGKAADD